ncbi:quinone oxidoreductase family protein [Thermaurantiacus sp.]
MAVRAIQFSMTGGPEVLEEVEVDVPAPGPGEVRVRHSAIGVNFIDTYHRSGVYPVMLPCTPGMEAAGVIEAVGEGVTGFAQGDRVVYFASTPGSYATHRTLAAHWLVKLPEAISDEMAAAAWLKASTVEFLVERCAKVQPGDTVVVTAAAGGVGLLLCQWLNAVGAQTVAVASTADKQALARAAGAHAAIGYERMAEDVRALTGGRGADVVIDGVGQATFEAALDSLKRRGLLISFGNASGKVGPVDFGILAAKGSLFTTRPTLFDYYAEPADFAAGTARVLRMLADGRLDVRIGRRWPLAEAAACHADLEARATSGSSLLIP